MRNIEDIVKAAEKHGIPVYDLVRIHPEKFLPQWMFLYPEMVVQPRLCSPADMECRMDMTL